jgi:HEAT repeat protein
MHIALRLLNSIYRVMRWLVLTLLVGGLLIGVVIFGPLASLVTTGKPQVADPRSWLSVQWILAHVTVSVLLALVILGLFGLSWLAHRAASSEPAQSVAPAQESGNWLRRLRLRLRYLPHHRVHAIVIALDAIYHVMAWIVGVIIVGGFGVGAIVDFITTGNNPITNPQKLVIIQLIATHPEPSIAVAIALVVLTGLGALAHSTAHPAIGFNQLSTFQAACESEVDDTIRKIPKYDPDLYVQRSGVAQEFEQFLRSPLPGLLVLGQAGMGKTNLLCEMARERAAHSPTLLLRGVASMEGKLGFWQVVANELSAKAKRKLDASGIKDMLDDALHIWDTDLVIFVDGINENARIDQLKMSLASAAQDARGTSIRICMSCRDVDWHAFAQEPGLVAELYQPDETSAGASQGVTIGEYTDEEFAKAWTKYSRHYHLVGDLNDRLTQICHHPLMLSFLCLAFKDQAVPPGVHRKEIFDEYWKEKLTKLSTENALLKLVASMYTQRYVEIPQRVAVEVIGPEDEYNRLLDEAVIIYAHTDRAGQQQVQFTYDAFFEYALARYLQDTWGWATKDAYDALADLRRLFAQADQYRFVQGSLQYLLLYLTNPNRKDALAQHDRAAALTFLLELAAASDTRWKVFVCDFATKVDEGKADEGKADGPTLADQLTSTLRRFASDGDSLVRWSAGAALGVLALNSPLADTLLHEMEQSAEWKERETAAVALGQFYHNFASLSERLERLADDINWRVRRQVGNTLDDLCRLAPQPALDLLRSWATSRRWRLRRAVVQARIGLLRNRELALELLPELSRDEVEEIRWRTVSDLANLIKVAPVTGVPAKALPLLHELSRDESSVWVRRHVAFWLPDLHQIVGADSNEIAVGLLGDKERDVRWETARAIGSLKHKTQAMTWLAALDNDPDALVQFAARYSLVALKPAEEHALAKLLNSPDDQIRLKAQEEQLARSSRVPDKPSGEDILNSAKPDRFANIQYVLKRGTDTLSPEQMRTFFDLLRKDEDEGIRWAAAGLLASVKVFDAARQDVILRDFIADPHYWTRRESLAALAKMMGSGFRPSQALAAQVIACCEDIEPEVRWEAIHCLRALQGMNSAASPEYPTATIAQALNGRLTDPDRQVRELVESLLAPAHVAPDGSHRGA